eukprot:TRINITY_DN33986_c0_g1_i11.p1 TRINITY_DN33986_c0_g1~~TRINITY_DN33986_c0_g1_i11.p1  ORF type:complete len:932 (+),score=126.14 TRINITY_DN33986_c0_g1_i11:322-2796(+)
MSQPHFGTQIASETLQSTVSAIRTQTNLEPLLSDLGSKLSQVNEIDLSKPVEDLTSGRVPYIDSIVISFKSIVQVLLMQLNDGSISASLSANPAAASMLSFIVVMLIALSTPQKTTHSQAEAVEEDLQVPVEYSLEEIEAFFQVRPVLVAKRSVRISMELIQFAYGVISDLIFNKFEENQKLRAQQLREAFERLGSAFIKVAQAVSTRVDIFPPVYIEQIELLQDRVPPFPTSDAIEVLESTYGVKVDQVFSEFSDKPIAAASLGQVYRGKLRSSGEQVAIKVQRPDVLEQVALDLFLMRKIATQVTKFASTNTEWQFLVDEWGSRYFQEMDYQKEAVNAQRFNDDIADIEGVFAPKVYTDLCSRKVLVTTWIEGERLIDSQAEDVITLCDTLLSAYLKQLLEGGFMHADPHPGNLIRTPDGRICILDFGLITQVSNDMQLALVSFIAHLQLQDWDALVEDLQVLGFITTTENLKGTELPQILGNIFSELVKGGGAKGINIETVIKEVNNLSTKYPVVRIPAFFTLILRTFTVIEGIALSADPNYAIVPKCFPYLANRLLNDDSPQVRLILKEVLYGDKKTIDVNRVRKLLDGIRDYKTDALTNTVTETMTMAPVIDPTLKQTIRVVFTTEGSYVQKLFVNEMVLAVDALSRGAMSELLRAMVVAAPGTIALQSLGPLRMVVFPFPTFVEVVSRLSPFVELTEEDKEALTTIKGLVEIVGGPQMAISNVPTLIQTPDKSRQLILEVAEMLPQLLPGMAYTGELFIRQLLSRMLTRLSEKLAVKEQPSPFYSLPPQPSFLALPQDSTQVSHLVDGVINSIKQEES